QRLERFRCFTLQISNHTASDVLNIERPLPQVRIINLAQSVGILSRYLLENEFDIAKVRLEFAQDLVDKSSVFDNEEVGIKDSGVFGANRLRNSLLHFQDLPARLNQSCFESPDLVRHISGLNMMARYFIAII